MAAVSPASRFTIDRIATLLNASRSVGPLLSRPEGRMTSVRTARVYREPGRLYQRPGAKEGAVSRKVAPLLVDRGNERARLIVRMER